MQPISALRFLFGPRRNMQRFQFMRAKFKNAATTDDIQKLVNFIEFRFHENAQYHATQQTARHSGNTLRKLLGHDARTIRVETNKPVAYESLDHIHPWGTKQDNSQNLAFNNKLFEWIPLEQLSVLDIGCSGGGFVKTLHDAGALAVGIEGSDYSKIRARAEWATIPHRLFTADATAPFHVTNGEQTQLFSVITSWEMIEHIEEEALAGVFKNMERHLQKNGVIIMSVSPLDDIIDGVNLHRTVKPYAWWIEKITQCGFKHHAEVITYFGHDDWIRQEDNAIGSFHLVLTRINDTLPELPH